MNNILSPEEIENKRKQVETYFRVLPKYDKGTTSMDMAMIDIQRLLATIDERTKERDEARLGEKVYKRNWFFFEKSANRNAKENEELKAKMESLEEEKKLLPNEIALNKLRFLSAVLSMEFKIQEPHFIERVDTFILKTIAKLKEENENLRREDKNVMDECNRLAGVVEDLQGENEKLKVELDNQKKYVEEEVENLASEMNIQACDFDKELWRHLRVTLKRFGLDWDNYPDGIHADEAIEHIDQTYRMFQKEIIELKEENEKLREQINSHVCVHLGEGV